MREIGFCTYVLLLTKETELALEYTNLPASALSRMREEYNIDLRSLKTPVGRLRYLKDVLQSGIFLYCEDRAHLLKDIFAAGISEWQLGNIVEVAGFSECIAVPIQMMKNVVGILVAGAKSLSPIDMPLIKLFADQISTALEILQLRMEAEAAYAELEEAHNNVTSDGWTG